MLFTLWLGPHSFNFSTVVINKTNYDSTQPFAERNSYRFAMNKLVTPPSAEDK